MNPITRTRESAFSYQCYACNNCCHNKLIQINPYELLRLSSCLGISTTQFRKKHLDGQFLKQNKVSGACQFLGKEGCTVHKDRPLVCRLYPLGRLRMDNGNERFTELEPHPKSKGVYGGASKVGDYLKTQKVSSFLKAEKSYLKLIQQMAITALNDESCKKDEAVPFKGTKKAIGYTDWVLDPDPIIEKYCASKNIETPTKVEQKLKFHLVAIQSWVEGKWDILSVT